MKPRALIYDCDGVLFESRAANLAYYNAVLKHFDVEPVTVDDRERAHLCHTAATPQVFAGLLGPQHAPEAIRLAAQLDYRDFISWMTPEPGLFAAMARLSAIFPLAVATNRGNSMSEILRHFQIDCYFSVVITSRDVERPKPYPDMLLLAAERLGRERDELLFIGDSELDAAAAAAAGIPFVAYRSIQPQAQTVQSHAELVELLLEI